MPLLWILIPCFNEEDVLPKTIPLFLQELNYLKNNKKINQNSKILFINDGSTDSTWEIIQSASHQNSSILGISQSRNRGHQNALFAGFMEAKDNCDIVITIDCDGQDDISVMRQMVEEYQKGNDIIYGVRSGRDKDTWLKKTTAQTYYKLLNFMGVNVVYNHADYRLASSKILTCLEDYKEVNLFLRGLFPEIGFSSSVVYYERENRIAGKSHYSLKKMLHLAFDGITSFTIKPIEYILLLGICLSFIGTIMLIFSFLHILFLIIGLFSFFFGVQITCIGIIGEYIGKTYMETKHRPRYIISERVGFDDKTV